MKISKIVKYLLSLALALLLLYFCFRGVKWEEFVSNLKNCRWGWVFLSMLIGLLSNWFRSERWRQILLPIDEKTSHLTSFNAVNIAYVANFVFPRIGEFVRCGVITKNSPKKASYDKVVGTVVTERSFDMIMLLFLIFLFLCFKWAEFGAFFMDQIWHPLAERLSFSLWWLVASLIVILCLCFYLLYRFRDSTKVTSKLWGIIVGLYTGVVSCFKMKRPWLFILHTILLWTAYYFMSYATMRALPIADAFSAVDAMFLMLVGSLGWVVPVPGGIGAFHYIVALAISTVYGLPFETGIIFATLSHESQSIMMIVSGLASYAHEVVKTSRS